jgi:CRISPR-associated endonuclease/helicase Cas3
MQYSYINRILNISSLISERSLFLFGPRQTGKSSFLREELAETPALSYSLLDKGLLLRLLADPTMIRREVEAKALRDRLVVIDEIQKCPALLDEVQLMIEERGIRFLLTGSSAHKLKAAGTNLLGGRARTRSFHPFTYPEIQNVGFSLARVMERGLLPPHYLSDSPDEDLAAYVDTYLAEEIAAEGISRNLPAFARFLQVAASTNARMVNYTNVAGDAQVPRQTVKLWYQVLVDTLLGFELPAFRTTTKRKSIETAKFYLFDIGVVRALRRLPPPSQESAEFGEAFEHFIFLEIRAWLDYRRPRGTLEYWRSVSGYEVDFVLEGELGIEVKATKTAQRRHLDGLRALREEGRLRRFILVCQEERSQLMDDVEVLPWREFLELLWSDSLLEGGGEVYTRVMRPTDLTIAHRRDSDGAVQSVSEHLCAVARLSARYAGAIGLPDFGELLGLAHDIGKYSDDFQVYIRSATGLIDEDSDDYVDAAGRRGKVDHSTAGAQLLYKKLAARGKKATYAGEIAALCIASHHSGLIDCLSPDGTDNLERRLGKTDEKTHLSEVGRKLTREVEKRLAEIIENEQALQPFYAFLEKIANDEKSKSLVYFQFGMLAKYLFSCLIDADRSDTADFEKPDEASSRKSDGYPDWGELERRLEARLSEYESSSSIAIVRRDISAACLEAGGRQRGVFFLTVPTGGGKTLASLRFALRHAREHGMTRIFYIIPFTSIIDQNAEQVRNILESSRYGPELHEKIVLEHHSNLTPAEETSRQKVLSENWDAPIVFTTSVQFLESIFGHGTRSIRRMHQLVNSVLIFDEAQMIPIRCVHLFNNTINFLVTECGSTAVICTATQPLLDEVDPARGSLRRGPGAEIVRDVRNLFAKLKRVEIVDGRKDGGLSLDEIATLAREEQKKIGSLLVIVNTKRSAKELYLSLRASSSVEHIHLSTNMCPSHRLRLLRHVRWLLSRGRPVICVSTQLIEAGVDVDFGAVIRYMAGLDSIAQAAGRCNRNGLRPTGRVTVVNPADENIDSLHDIKIGRDCAERVMRELKVSPEAFDNDLLGPKAMRRYFELYFFSRKQEMSYSVGGNSPVGRNDELLSLLSLNQQTLTEHARVHSGAQPRTKIWQSFGSASAAFRAIDSPTQGIIVPFREGRQIINDLLVAKDVERRRDLLKQAQRYSVNIFQKTRDKLLGAEAIHEVVESGAFYLDPEYYDSEFGVNDKRGKLDPLID